MMANVDRCAACWAAIPEGRQICPACERDTPRRHGRKSIRTLVYIAHPFGGKAENVGKVQEIIKRLIAKHKECVFYSPLHATGFYYNDVSYLDGLNHCLEVLSRCDELWLCEGWQDSRGCNTEYGFAKAKGIPIEFINN